MPDDCHFPENDEKDDSDMEFDIGHAQSPPMNTNIFSASVNPSATYYDDSSDEAPDDVSFETSKASALQEIKHAFETVRQQKQKLREKRQKKQEAFAAQKLEKKRKQDELAKYKLPDDMLPTIRQATNEEENSLNVSHEENVRANKAPQSSSISKTQRRRKKLKQLRKPAGELPPKEKLDLIPMDSKTTEFHVQVLEKKVDSVVAKSVLLKDLKSRLIFGKVKRREPALKAMAKLAKQEVAGLNSH